MDLYKLNVMTPTSERLRRRAAQLIRAQDQLLEDLIAVRIQRGLTQATIGERMGVSQPAVAAFERYDANPTLQTVSRYAHAVGARIEFKVSVDTAEPLGEPRPELPASMR